MQSKGLSRVFSNTTVQKYQFLGAHESGGQDKRCCNLRRGPTLGVQRPAEEMDLKVISEMKPRGLAVLDWTWGKTERVVKGGPWQVSLHRELKVAPFTEGWGWKGGSSRHVRRSLGPENKEICACS